jgi:hypothetical protein
MTVQTNMPTKCPTIGQAVAAAILLSMQAADLIDITDHHARALHLPALHQQAPAAAQLMTHLDYVLPDPQLNMEGTVEDTWSLFGPPYQSHLEYVLPEPQLDRVIEPPPGRLTMTGLEPTVLQTHDQPHLEQALPVSGIDHTFEVPTVRFSHSPAEPVQLDLFS